MFMIKYLPKIFKTAKRDENTTLIYIGKKDFDCCKLYCYTFSIPQILVK